MSPSSHSKAIRLHLDRRHLDRLHLDRISIVHITIDCISIDPVEPVEPVESGVSVQDSTIIHWDLHNNSVRELHSTMSCKGIGGTSETEPWLVQQTLEESSKEREQGFIHPRISRKDQRRLNKEAKKRTVHHAESNVPLRTVGHTPKAKSNSSLRVQGLQLLTSVAGLPQGKNQRRRTRARNRKLRNLGSMDTAPLSQAKRLELSHNFRGSQILDRIPLGYAKLRLLAGEKPGSWLAPTNDTQKKDFLRAAAALAITRDDIQCSPPIFYCGDDSSTIDGIPNNAIVRNVSSALLVVDTVHGFTFPFSSLGQEDIVLVRRVEAIQQYDNSHDHALLLDSLNVLSNCTHNKGVVRGKKRIVAFQEGSNYKYLTPGIFPNRATTGTSVRGLFDLDVNQHDALFRYVKMCEKLAMNSMSLPTTRGFSNAKKVFPFRTFPGRGNHDSACRAFSSIATALNVCLNSHTDDDSFYGVVTDLDADPLKSPQLDDNVALYFTFPTLGLAIALRPGDILFFNPAIFHSVSSRCDPTKNIWCTSLYTKNAVVGGNDNSQAIESKQSEAMGIARSIIQGCNQK